MNFVREFFSLDRLADLSLTFIFYYLQRALHAKIKTKNIEESANYQLRCCTSEFSLWERRGKWRGKCEIRNYRFNPAQCVVFPPMCKYHVISRVWLNLDVSLSAFKSTILRLSNEFWISSREKYPEKESVEILNSIFAILNFYFTDSKD